MIKYGPTDQHSFLSMQPATGTSSTRRPTAKHVFYRDMSLPEPIWNGDLSNEYYKAAANGREHAWEAFVEFAAKLAPRATRSDLNWIESALLEATSLRATVALARALGTFAEAREEYRPPTAAVFEALAKRHSSTELRGTILEWALELGPDAAHRIAELLAKDQHPAIRAAAQAMLSAQ